MACSRWRRRCSTSAVASPGCCNATPKELAAIKGLGPAKRAELLAVIEMARRALAQQLQAAPVFDHPGRVKDYLALQLGSRAHETFAVLFLDSQHRLLRLEEMFHGTLSQTSVYPREVVQARAGAQCRRRGAGAQPPFGRGRALACRRVPDADAEVRRCSWSTCACSTTWSSGRARSSRWPSADCCDGGAVLKVTDLGRTGGAAGRAAAPRARGGRTCRARARGARGGRAPARACFTDAVGAVTPLPPHGRTAARTAAPGAAAAPARTRRAGRAGARRCPTRSTSNRCCSPTTA